MSKLYLDSETCGLCGPAVLIQYALDDGPIVLHTVWNKPIGETLDLIEMMCNHTVVAFNLVFDWFQISKLYNMFRLLPRDWYPDEHIEEIALIEEKARTGVCLKPVSALDLMLHARKGPYQATMEREDIRIRRIPTPLAWKLAAELEKRIQFSQIMFARRKQQNRDKWVVEDIEKGGVINPDFKNVVLRFDASTALKNLAADALKIPVIQHKEIALPPNAYPEEYGWAPFCTAVGKPGKWNNAWPAKIQTHIRHWSYNVKAKEYAAQDIDLLRKLEAHFQYPEPGDDDSVLACMVAAVRWKGFALDLVKLKEQREAAAIKAKSAPTDPGACTRWLHEVMEEAEKLVMDDSTAKPVLEEISKWEITCCGKSDCKECGGTGARKHEAAKRAIAITESRKATKEVELYDKLLIAKRFHASFKIIGALSGRMSGADGLNPQGIKRTKDVRSIFTFADDGEVLSGGDFNAFEVGIAEAVYNDPKLREILLAGKKIHALLAMKLFPGFTYEQIMESSGTHNDMYEKGKRGIFLLIYGGGPETMVEKGIAPTIELATKAFNEFLIEFPGIGAARKKITEMFCSMRQPNGIGTEVEWHDPAEFISSLFGFRRYFTLENQICKSLFELSNAPPKDWRQVKVKVVRRDREQTASGATQSALYGAAFGIQAANLRAAANHEIQSTGAGITKNVQRRVWDIQPSGIGPWLVAPFNNHDEILTVTAPSHVDIVAKTIKDSIELYRPRIPMIKMKWNIGMSSWAAKGD